MSSYLIIEKDNDSVNNIKEVMEDYMDFRCVGVTDDRDNSLNLILKRSPDLVFFNIDNALENPFQFISELHQYLEELPKFIGISSTGDNAYFAIKSNFFDYLLSPLKEVDIRIAIKKFQKHYPQTSQTQKTICLKSYQDYQYLETDEILYLEADNNSTDFHMKDGNTISAFKTLKTFEKSLPKNFIRVHKSYIVNSDYIKRINYGKKVCIIRKCDCVIPFTKTYLDSIELLNNKLSQTSAN
ncbi:MAG: LytTR family DNA-binding domain-containing protein [Bacteroidota bacterium]